METDWQKYMANGERLPGHVPPTQASLYMSSLKNIFKHTDVLKWWAAHEHDFPLASKAARGWIAVPPAQSFVERGFSSGKITMNRLRTQLPADMFETLVVLYMNRHLLCAMDAKRKRRGEDGDGAQGGVAKKARTGPTQPQ